MTGKSAKICGAGGAAEEENRKPAAPQALQYTKQLTRHGADAIREQIKKESVLFAERMFSDETRAIFDKFLNKK